MLKRFFANFKKDNLTNDFWSKLLFKNWILEIKTSFTEFSKESLVFSGAPNWIDLHLIISTVHSLEPVSAEYYSIVPGFPSTACHFYRCRGWARCGVLFRRILRPVKSFAALYVSVCVSVSVCLVAEQRRVHHTEIHVKFQSGPRSRLAVEDHSADQRIHQLVDFPPFFQFFPAILGRPCRGLRRSWSNCFHWNNRKRMKLPEEAIRRKRLRLPNCASPKVLLEI